MKHLLEIGLALSLLVFPGCGSDGEDPIQNELELAKRDGSMVLVEFFTKNCPTCARFDMKVLSDPEVRTELRDVRIVKVSAGKYRSVAERYGVQKVPDVRLLSSTGRPLFRHEGYLSAEKLIAAVRSCRGGR